MARHSKSRLDVLLHARGLVVSRARAADLIRRGLVRVDGVAAAKPGLLVSDDARLEVGGDAERVSRGACKLDAALDAYAIAVEGRAVLDIGASTGGFTQVLLERGAARVYAVDVGHGQLHRALAGDPRVVNLEGCDVRRLSSALVPEPVSGIVADVSFISLTLALPAALALAGEGCWLIALVKPQFEAGRAAIGKGGVVRAETDRLAAVDKVRTWMSAQAGWRVVGVMPSPIAGRSGNREFLLAARRGA